MSRIVTLLVACYVCQVFLTLEKYTTSPKTLTEIPTTPQKMLIEIDSHFSFFVQVIMEKCTTL
jgi:hypothetical protein